MSYSRRQFLRYAAAGLSVGAGPLLFPGKSEAESSHLPKSQGPGKSTKVLSARKPYSQAKADMIHNRSVEMRIKEAGEKPDDVKARANRRIRSLKGESQNK